MSGFLSALLHYPFLQHALAACLLASLGCGIMGSYTYVKRITFLAGGISHAVLGGMGIAWFLGGAPLVGALAAAVVAALLIGWIHLHRQQHEDTLIGAFWSVGMALGILFISKTPGYDQDLMSYLFGNVLMVTPDELLLMGGLDAVILALVVRFHKELLAVCFDTEFARLRGLPVQGLYLLLLVMVALTVVLLIQVVGLILVIALLTLPAGIARMYARTLAGMMVRATLLGALFTTGGLALSYATDLPTGATIILLAGLAYGSLLFWHGRHRAAP
ncbi:MAG: metal ABC transporter permease [Gammaproteobacteria bacterium]|nr:MAG: metal ABC transporter permease [Gammaproteobacteria bacterium]